MSDVEHLNQQDHIHLNNVENSTLPSLSSYQQHTTSDVNSQQNIVAGTSMTGFSSPGEQKTQIVVNIGGNPNSMQTTTTTNLACPNTNMRNTRSHLNSSTKSNHSIKSNNTPSVNNTTNLRNSTLKIFKSQSSKNDEKYKFNLLSGHQESKWHQFFIILIFLLFIGIAIISVITLISHLSGTYYCKSDKGKELVDVTQLI